MASARERGVSARFCTWLPRPTFALFTGGRSGPRVVICMNATCSLAGTPLPRSMRFSWQMSSRWRTAFQD